jgi:phosphatidylserine/phosphatidylglycerophosphate/cardiolipin synthase-like enzyme
VDATEWLLTAAERDNDATVLDSRHADGLAWTDGNDVRPLIHGATYFARLLEEVQTLRAGDLLLFTDWRGDPDQRLDEEPGHEIATVFADAARRGVIVRGLLWRSHWDRLAFSAAENRNLGEDIEAAGGECLLDMRVRVGGSHHQKFVVLRHVARPELDVAFVGGIDLCNSRRDDAMHGGDPTRQSMAAVYGDSPPWHDVQLEIRGPAVGDVETVFRERWNDPAPLTRHPVYRLGEVLRREDTHPQSLPAQTDDPPSAGTCRVQILRTYPHRRRGYPFAPNGERSVARAYMKVTRHARRFIYVEDQYLWSNRIVECFTDALARDPDLLVIAVVPHYPDQDGRFTLPPNLVGRRDALAALQRAGGDRVAVYGVENHAGTPVYVHAKVCVIDDAWAAVGSDNFNRRSWTHDSELSCAVIDPSADGLEDGGTRSFARELRLRLAVEHLDRTPGDELDLIDPHKAFDTFRASAEALQQWHDGGCVGERPPGRLRPYHVVPQVSRWSALWSRAAYRVVYDPDGRSSAMRRANAF